MSAAAVSAARRSRGERRHFPGWRWLAGGLAFPLARFVGGAGGRPVDAILPALIGGAITGAGLSTVQWWAANGALGRATQWISTGSAGYAVGLAAGSALVAYQTDLLSLVVMGVVSGAGMGAAQALA